MSELVSPPQTKSVKNNVGKVNNKTGTRVGCLYKGDVAVLNFRGEWMSCIPIFGLTVDILPTNLLKSNGGLSSRTDKTDKDA